MDMRWRPVGRDSQRDVKVILHPTAAPHEVRMGVYRDEDDSIDLSQYVSQAQQTAFDCNVTLSFNRELFGTNQPKPNQILEVQLRQDNVWKPLWIGVIDAINSFTLQRGTRSLQLVAKTREQGDIWKNTKRLTPLFPQLTNFTYIADRVARSAGLRGDEIAFPTSAYTTAHSNTQLADMTAWDMITQVFLPIGWTPFIDAMGRLRAADRGLQGRKSDIVLDDTRLIKVGGQRQKPPKSRVRVLWLNPTLKKYKRQGQMLAELDVTLGWFMPYYHKKVYFSEDRTQRATGTYLVKNPSCNSVWSPKFVGETWIQQTENGGKLKFVNFQTLVVGLLIAAWTSAHNEPDLVNIDVIPPVTIPQGRLREGFYQAAFCYLMTCVGTGHYEIWGNPFDWVHARNISDAFDSSVPTWVDNSIDIESDFVVNEEHAKAMAIRELIYQAREANKWSITIADDPRIEYGDILEFTDGSQLYVQDFTRRLERGSEATLDISGFLVGPTTQTQVTVPTT